MGLPASFDEKPPGARKYSKCEFAIYKKYAVKYSRNRGCIYKKRWKRHNEKVKKKLVKRNGDGWEDKMYAELAKCKI